MASWGLACKNCHAVFTHSQIPNTLADYYLPIRPEFPPDGLERECPNCKARPPTSEANSRFGSDLNGGVRGGHGQVVPTAMQGPADVPFSERSKSYN